MVNKHILKLVMQFLSPCKVMVYQWMQHIKFAIKEIWILIWTQIVKIKLHISLLINQFIYNLKLLLFKEVLDNLIKWYLLINKWHLLHKILFNNNLFKLKQPYYMLRHSNNKCNHSYNSKCHIKVIIFKQVL
jgi:hypothetical protein